MAHNRNDKIIIEYGIIKKDDFGRIAQGDQLGALWPPREVG